MKTAMTVLFVIAMLIASTQTFRHVYVKWIEPDTSVLDEFKGEVETEIDAARTLDELVELYREVRLRADEAGLSELDQRGDFINRRDDPPSDAEMEIMAEMRQISQEIQSREHDTRQLFKLKFYWLAGLASLLIGIFVFRNFNAWLGFSGIVIGFSEMLCWTSPLFHTRVMSQQFEVLLNYKLILSLLTWLILVVFWLVTDRKAGTG